MIGIDTYKFSIPGPVIMGFDKDKFKPVPEYDDCGNVFHKRYDFKREKGTEDGLTFANIDGIYGTLTVQGSSNFTSYNPNVMLTKKNVGQTFDKLSKYLGVEFDREVAIRNAKLWKADFTKTIDVGSRNKVDRSVELMKLLGNPEGYSSVFDDNRGRGNGITFAGTAKSNKKRFTLYNKEAEFKEKHRKLFKRLTAAGIKFEGLLRAEFNAKTPSLVRDMSGAVDSMLGNVLEGPNDPVDLMFEEIVTKAKLLEIDNPVASYAGLKLTDLRDIDKEYLRSNFDIVNSALNLINTYGPDEKLIRAYHYGLGFSRSATSKRIKKMRPIINAFLAQSIGNGKKNATWIIREIQQLRELFKAA